MVHADKRMCNIWIYFSLFIYINNNIIFIKLMNIMGKGLYSQYNIIKQKFIVYQKILHVYEMFIINSSTNILLTIWKQPVNRCSIGY